MSDKLNILQRLHSAMAEVDYIQKEKKAGMQYTIVSHDAVTAKVRPVLVKHGIVYYPVKLERSQDGNRTQIDLTVRFANIDDSADFIDVASCGYGVDTQDKGPGKAISYAVKYALLKALGLETGDDPDLESIAHAQTPTVDAKKEQYRMFNEFNQINSPKTMETWWDENAAAIETLPAEYKELVTDAFQMRLQGIENGTAPKSVWKWSSVGEQDQWIEKAAKVKFSGCDTLQELATAQSAVQHKIEALEAKRKAALIEFVQQRRAAIETAAANAKTIGA